MIRVLLSGVPADAVPLVNALEADGDVQVVGRCTTDDAVVDAVRSLHPDVVLASGARDVATSAVQAIMAYAPTPVLVLRDTLAGGDEGDVAAGAVGVVVWSSNADSALLRRKVRVLSRVAVVRRPRPRVRETPHANGSRATLRAVVGMAASTGGPPALVEVIRGLRDITAPVLIVQHIHPGFVAGLAEMIHRATGVDVTLAEDGAALEPGRFTLAPAGVHLSVTPAGRLRLDTEPQALHRPSADVLFTSMAASLGRAAVGVLLTGMGVDGANGLLALRRAGGTGIAQDSGSSVIDGMPKAARELGAANVVAPLRRVAAEVLRAVEARG